MSTFLITGASKGIGKQMAIELAQKNKTLVLVARNQALLDELVEHLAQYKCPVYAIAYDVTNFDGYEQLLQRATRMAGPIDTLVLNAGILYKNAIGKGFKDDKATVDTNLLGPMAFIHAFVSYASEIDHPHVVVVSSICLLYTSPSPRD